MPPQRRPKLTEQDRRDWAIFARHLRPLPGKALADLPPEPPDAPVPRPQPPEPTPRKLPPPLASALSVGTQPGGLDNGMWNRFRSGKLPPPRALDLHGRH